MQAFDIRLLTPDDAAAYKRLRVEAARDSAFGATFEVEQALPIEALRPLLHATDEGFILGALDTDDLVGMIGFGAGLDDERGTLFGLFVQEGCRRSGLGRMLVRALLSQVPDAVRRIELFVESGNRAAISLYEAERFSLESQVDTTVRMERVI